MKEHTRNLAVGLTVIVALLMLGVMILLFTGLPEMFQRGRVIRMNFPATADVHAGDWVHLAGMRVGKVTDITFADDDPRRGVQFVARIDEGVRVPADVLPRVYTRGFVGGAYLELVPGGPDRFDPRTGEKLEFLPDDWDQPLKGELKGTGLIPDELLVAVRGLARLAENLNDLISPARPETAPATAPVASRPSGPAGGALRDTLAKLGRALDALETVLGDADNQANIKKSMANLALATAKASDAMDALKGFAAEAGKAAVEVRKTVVDARETMTEAGKTARKLSTLAGNADARLQELSAKLIEDAEKLSALLATINRVATKMESGEGTAGQLINDPKLYNSLLEASQQLAGMMKELRGLVEHVKKHGLPLKVK
jgi:phospholipid/cholesterol/gamma-HCH transport system substrate-binding protein